MDNLNALVQERNEWRALGKREPLDMNSSEDRQTMACYIDNSLSPENLTCDGELRGPQLRAKEKRLIGAAEELLKLDPSVKFSEYSPR